MWSYVSSSVLSVIPAWHTTISLDSCYGMPYLQKGKKHEPVNYRPVSLTTFPCKIMEHCIVSIIWSHLNKHSITTSKQHGFRRGMSCETQLIEAAYDWTNILNKVKDQIDVIILDIGKAFDVVPHHRLLMKLCMYGIAGKTHGWIEDFIGNITHEVVVNGSKSERGIVKSGAPQGTVLGPLLFLIYNNDIESQSPVLFDFLLMIVPFTDQHILKVIPFHYNKIYSSCRSWQVHGKWHLMLANASYFVSLNNNNNKGYF